MKKSMETSPLLGNKNSSHDLKQLKDLEHGRQEDGDSGAGVLPPDDFDMAKFNRGRLFFRDNLFSCCMGMFFALIVGLCFPDFLQTLIFTNHSDTPKRAHQRYVSTFKHIASWHYGDVWEEGSKSQKSVKAVRKMHKNVRGDMAKDGRGHYLSQYNMALVQSAFISFPLVYGQEFGIKCSLADLDDYVYFWYGIGYLLGIDSKYNICSGGREQAKIFCENIRDEIVLPCLENPCDDFYSMSDALIKGWQKYILGSLTVSFVINFFLKITTPSKAIKFGFVDSLRYYFWILLFAAIRRITSFKKFMNSHIEKEFNLTFSKIIL